jgi:hypothetical protein
MCLVACSPAAWLLILRTLLCLPVPPLLLLLQAVVKVDEEGTEAAAVTAVVFGPTAVMGGGLHETVVITATH